MKEVTEAITALLGALAWPAVVLVCVVLLRRELGFLLGRVQVIEGPAHIKITLDPHKVEQIIKEGQKENISPAAVAERIVQSAIVLEKGQARILRALLDDDGRMLWHYQTEYYRSALESLIAKGYVRKIDKGFALTEEGRRVTKEYVLGVLRNLEMSEPEQQSTSAHS